LPSLPVWTEADSRNVVRLRSSLKSFFLDPLEVSKGYLDFFEIDVFVESESGLASRLGVSDDALRFDQPRVLSTDAFFEPSQTIESEIHFELSIFDLYQDLYQDLYLREFKFIHRHFRRAAIELTSLIVRLSRNAKAVKTLTHSDVIAGSEAKGISVQLSRGRT
jgi:hypothetical protein